MTFMLAMLCGWLMPSHLFLRWQLRTMRRGYARGSLINCSALIDAIQAGGMSGRSKELIMVQIRWHLCAASLGAGDLRRQSDFADEVMPLIERVINYAKTDLTQFRGIDEDIARLGAVLPAK